MNNESPLLNQFEDYIINDLRLKRINCCIKHDKQNEKLVLGIFDKKVYQETVQNIQQNLHISQSENVKKTAYNYNNLKQKKSTTPELYTTHHSSNFETVSKISKINDNIKTTNMQKSEDKEIDDLIDSLNNLNQICNHISCSKEGQKNYTLQEIDSNNEKQAKDLQKIKESQLNLFIKYQNLIPNEQQEKQNNLSIPDFSSENTKNFFNTKIEHLSLKHKFDDNHQFFSFAGFIVVVKYVDFELYQQLMKNEEALKASHHYNNTNAKNTVIEPTHHKLSNLHLLEEIHHHRDEKKAPLCMNANMYHSINHNINNNTTKSKDEGHEMNKSASLNDKIHANSKTHKPEPEINPIIKNKKAIAF